MLILREADPRHVGPYRILARLRAGGMGQVYLGAGAHGDLVAVKLVHAPYARDPEFRARFRSEVALGSRVAGPGTAAIVAADPDASVPWLATEYVPGPALDEAVRETGPLPTATVHVLAAGLAAALAGLHATGLVHRDVKPANVLLAAGGPRLIDFGIARVADATQLTTTGKLIGSPGFMSPEQAEGATVGPESDVFSLAAVLVYAALGRGPFGDGNQFVLMNRIVDEPPDLSGLAGFLREPVAACLAKVPGNRPTAVEFADLVGPPLEPVPPAPAGAWLPASVLALMPDPVDLAPTVVGVDASAHSAENTLIASRAHAVAPPAAPAPRVRRRALLVGAGAALGLAAIGGVVGAVAASRSTASGPATAPTSPVVTRPTGAATATERWAVPGLRSPDVIVAVADVVCVGGAGSALALDAANGVVRWRFDSPGANLHYPVEIAADDASVYVSAPNAAVALDAATGRERWRKELDPAGDESFGQVLVSGGTAYITRANQLIALDAVSGAERWTHSVSGSPAIDGGRIVVTDGSAVDALDAATGRPLWQHTLGGNGAALAAGDGAVFAGVSFQGVIALDIATGAPRWQAAAGAQGVDTGAAPVVVNGSVVVLGYDKQMYAFETATGALRWRGPDPSNGGGPVDTQPEAWAGLVYAGNEHGHVYATDAVSGALRWVYRSSGYNPIDAVAVTDGSAFAASDETVLALGQP